jgi:hypothetical protein
LLLRSQGGEAAEHALCAREVERGPFFIHDVSACIAAVLSTSCVVKKTPHQVVLPDRWEAGDEPFGQPGGGWIQSHENLEPGHPGHLVKGAAVSGAG